jgi:acid phosphatase (class A)
MARSSNEPTDIGGADGMIKILPSGTVTQPCGTVTLTSPLPGWYDIFTEPDLRPPVQMIGGTQYPDNAWDPTVKAQAIAAAFLGHPGWQERCDPGKPDDSDQLLTHDETALIADRGKPILLNATRIDEITVQAQDFSPYWANLLSCFSPSRPATWGLVLATLEVGYSLALYFKLKYKRARPAQVWTAVAPIIPTPAYPSYPNGHALQAHLIAESVKLVVPAMASASEALAKRIAVNRELAGVHFPSDTAASVRMVPPTLGLLKEFPEFIRLVEKAKEEWQHARMIPAPRIPRFERDVGTPPPTS